MKKMGPKVNHLSFAEDVIIFTSTCIYSLSLIMKTLHIYEKTSGQLINKEKSHFKIPYNAPQDRTSLALISRKVPSLTLDVLYILEGKGSFISLPWSPKLSLTTGDGKPKCSAMVEE